MTNLIGHSLGRYHILEQLGEGGMAVVYKARDTRLDIDVALKVIRTENILPSALDRTLKRFEREAKALARLTHPNIVKVTDYGEYENMPYLVMPLLSGGTLKNKLSGTQIPWQDAARILIPIAEALEYAHQHDIIHRDVKPANILITENGQPMLADFGVAKILDVEETMELTGTGVGIGTPEYMAPEQVTNKQVDARADVYALGIVLFEMVTGRKPFVADTPMAVLIMHSRDPLPRLKSFAPNLPQSVENVLIKALAKDPQNRYQSMAEFAKAMEGLSGGKKVNEGGKYAGFKLPAVPRRAAITVGLIALGLGLFAVFSKSPPSPLFAAPTPSVTPTRKPTSTFTPAPALTVRPTHTPRPTSTVTPDTRALNPANQHLYLYVNQGKRWNGKTWQEARSYCVLLGGHLVTIQDDAENTFIYKLTAGNTWLGATDEVREGRWAWVSGEPWNYSNWASGEPNNAQNEDYLNYNSKYPFSWNDASGQGETNFVCEWEPASP